jgi:hypothetical protein
MIDRLLLAPVQTTLNGKPKKITALEAIIYQLLRQEQAGDTKASAALLKYEDLVRCGPGKGLAILVADTQSLDLDPSEASNG